MSTTTTGKTSFKFTFGEMTCWTIMDGFFSFPARNLFQNAPQPELNDMLQRREIQDGKVSTPFRCLLVQTKDTILLIDTGLGVSTGPNTGQLVQNIRDAGISPDSVDTVVFSHGHVDHTGGAINEEGTLSFPNARHYMGRQEFQFWMSDLAIDLAGEVQTMSARKILLKLQNKLSFIEPQQEVIPGIRAISSPGHTPFNFAFVLTSGNRKAYYMADEISHLIHLEKPDWYLITDVDPLQALKTREHMLKNAVAENFLVIAYHLPYPGVGYIRSKPENQFDWSPLI